MINNYSQGSNPAESLGPHWERPGRTIVDGHLLAIPEPDTVVPDAFQDFERLFFTGSSSVFISECCINSLESIGDHYPHLPNPRPVILHKKMTWDDLLSYFRTFSSLHTFHEKYPEDLKRPDGDIAVRFLNRLKAHVAQHENKEVESIADEIDVEWPLALILARRK